MLWLECNLTAYVYDFGTSWSQDKGTEAHRTISLSGDKRNHFMATIDGKQNHAPHEHSEPTALTEWNAIGDEIRTHCSMCEVHCKTGHHMPPYLCALRDVHAPRGPKCNLASHWAAAGRKHLHQGQDPNHKLYALGRMNAPLEESAKDADPWWHHCHSNLNGCVSLMRSVISFQLLGEHLFDLLCSREQLFKWHLRTFKWSV